MWEKKNCYTLTVGVQASAACMEISLEVPPQAKTPTRSSFTTQVA